jgi:hypothetical protein
MRTKISMHGVSVLLLVLFIVLALGSGTSEGAVQDDTSGVTEVPVVYTEIPFSDLMQSIANINEPGHGFILDAFIGGDSDYIMLCDSPIESRFSPPRNTIELRNAIRGKDWEDITKGYDKNILCKVYIEVFASDWYDGNYGGFVLKIEGLLTPEQVAQRKTEADEAEEAERLAREEANRYDPAKFTVVPDNFNPANYTSIDLFKAVSDSRNLQRVSNKLEALNGQMQSAFMFGMGGSYILMYKSDLTFVRQDGTDITFSSDDNAITQNMTIDQRSGLQARQKVRVYYEVTRSPLITWDVVAIERR